jgi:glutamate--cysteine ligase catalytic subunit
MNHARYLHDMMMPFTGIMAALSAAGPVQKGQLSDNDMRWTVIEQAVDCRNANNRNPQHEDYIPKSRYSAMNHYISDHEFVKDELMDTLPIKYDPEFKELLIKEGGLDERLADHVARIFTRDPVPAYEGEFVEEYINNDEIVSHFENVQSTNWNSMRFKPPPG